MRTLNPTRLSEILTASAADNIAEGKIHGAAVIVNQCGKRVFTANFGTDGTNGAPLAPGTVYRAASMTKPITAVALLQQVAAGKVDLRDEITKFLPEYVDLKVGHPENGKIVVDGDVTEKIRVYHLLTHTSGIGSGELRALQDEARTPDDLRTLEASVHYFSKQVLDFQPGTKGLYSPVAGMDAVARIVEIVSGEDFESYLRRHVSGPIGMKDTTFCPSDDQWARMVTMHGRTEDGKSMDQATVPGCVFANSPATYYCGGGGLATTAEDYSLFAEMLLNDGKTADGREILPAELVASMSTPWVSPEVMPGRQRWGLGVRVITAENYTLPVGAFGWSGAYGTHFWVDPVNRITAVYMKNSRYDGGSGAKTSAQFEADVMAALND